MVSGARETNPFGGDPKRVVIANAYRKAAEVSRRVKNGIVIGADTMVLSDGRLIGKLKSRALVRRAMKWFQKDTIRVYTGLALIDAPGGRCVRGYAVSRLRMRRLRDDEIDRWLDRLEPLDKAGGFSIEGPGSLLFPHIEGCFYNILGLPMSKLDEMFRGLGYNLLDFMKG
jgi:septum formation protein